MDKSEKATFKDKYLDAKHEKQLWISSKIWKDTWFNLTRL